MKLCSRWLLLTASLVGMTWENDSRLSTNWLDVTAASLTNQVAIPIGPAGSAFFRLVYP